MSPEDKKRLERERDLFRAKNSGPDYKVHNESVQRWREEMAKRQAARAHYEKMKAQRWRSNGER